MEKDFRLMRDNGIGFMSNEIDTTDNIRTLEEIKKELEEMTSNKYFIIDFNSLDEESKKAYNFLEKEERNEKKIF